MKALNLYGVQDVRYEDVRKPEIEKENDVLIKVNTAGICGSDISRFGKIGSYNPGLTWGHEFSGIVESTGRGVTSVSKGDRVTACNCFPCFHCDYCKQGNYARCTDMKVLGGQVNGAFAEYIRMPAENVLKLPDSMDFATASLIPTKLNSRSRRKQGQRKLSASKMKTIYPGSMKSPMTKVSISFLNHLVMLLGLAHRCFWRQKAAR
ncbi:TPA: alcohol dehydrogenase catalytic domain-containing protein [Salmonella enterica]|nr:alcohol dehydrogenase catalytic domain-containing protein [Salmonella enterica]